MSFFNVLLWFLAFFLLVGLNNTFFTNVENTMNIELYTEKGELL